MRNIKWKIYSLIVVLVIGLNVLAWNSRAFCDWYISHVFPIWVNTYGRLTGIFPFSVGEIMIVLGLVLVTVAVILGLVWGAMTFACGKVQKKRASEVSLRSMDMLTVSLAKQEKRTRGHHLNKFNRFCRIYFQVFAWILAVVALVMTLNCFILYHASTFSEKYFSKMEGYELQKEYTLEDLIKLRAYVVEKCNRFSGEMPRDERGFIVYEGDFAAGAKSSMKNLGETYSCLKGYYPTPKPLFFSDFLSQQYMTGYYFPFSMEANYNKVMYVMNKPATYCHELAHLKGYIYEDEANFIAYLACVGAEDELFQYAGYLSVLNYIDNDFYDSVEKNRDRYLTEINILAQVHEDNVFLTREEWERIEDKAVFDTETVDAVSDSFTDTTLKLNGVSDGMASYSRVVELLLQYYDIYGYPED